MIDVTEFSYVSEKDTAEINILLQDLTGRESELLPDDVNARISGVRLFGVVEKGEIIGLATLVIFHALTGKRARIEDVIVSKEHRRRGLGRSLCQKMIHEAGNQNVVAIDLTSHPSRGAANELYKSLGFARGDTNVYRLTL